MAGKIADPRKLTKNFSIDKKVRSHIARADCEKCFRWDAVTAYVEDLKDRSFGLSFFDCPKCETISCGVCASEDESCPSCGNGLLKALTPQAVFEECERVRNG